MITIASLLVSTVYSDESSKRSVDTDKRVKSVGKKVLLTSKVRKANLSEALAPLAVSERLLYVSESESVVLLRSLRNPLITVEVFKLASEELSPVPCEAIKPP